MVSYEFIDHTADLGIVIRGQSLQDLFAEAGRVLFQLLVKVKAKRKTQTIRCVIEGSDLEDLMVNWLRELLYLFNGEEKVVSAIRILRLGSGRLEAELELVPFAAGEDEALTEIKAVTYHQIRVESTDSGFEAAVIFDT